MLMRVMMMTVTDRKQKTANFPAQIDYEHQQPTNTSSPANHHDVSIAGSAVGKTSNSSSETVIARIESPRESFRDSNSVNYDGKFNSSHQSSNEVDAKREDSLNSAVLVANFERADAAEQSSCDNLCAIDGESLLNNGGRTTAGDSANNGSGVGGKQKGSSSKLKAFLMLANHLNPFHSTVNGGSHMSSSHHATHLTPARPRKDSLLGTYPISGQPGSNSPPKPKSLLNLLSIAQRYFTSSSTRQSCGFNNGEHHKQANNVTKSAPVTPIKWQPLETNGCEFKVNGLNNAAAADETLTQRLELAAGKLTEDYALNQPSKAVRFVESLPAGKRESNKSAIRLFADCGVQTSEDGSNGQSARGNNDSEDEDDARTVEEKSAALVAQLFKTSDHLVGAKGETPMDSGRFKDYGYKLIDYISNYLDTIRDRRVTPLNIEPGYLKSLIQADAPEQGETFANIMQDFENHIMCGITHWQHPHFHAYFPAGNAYPSILADMLSDALGCVGFSWAASPAYTELEIIMLDWMGKMIGLPDEFLCLSGGRSGQDSKGGGVIQGSASECVLVNLLAARHWAIERLRKKYPNTPDGMLLSKLIGYCSKEAHSCVEKAAMIGFIRMRTLDTDEKHSLRGETLARAISMDMANGLEPFIVCATLGTTSCVSFDNLEELGKICKENDIWLHVDAAYAGSALICPEFKYLMKGIENATSFNMNPNKWMLINFDCSLMWVKDRFKLTRAFVVDPLYLQHSFSDQAIDYRHWGIPLSRRFRALKLWFVIRNYGVEGLRSYIRNHVKLAKLFEQCIKQDPRFTITNEVVLGLVCFRLVGSNALNQRLLSMINASGKLHMVPASLNGRYVIRFCVCDQNAQEVDIKYAYKCISEFATELFESIRAGKERIRAISQQNTIDVSSMSLHTQQSASADRLNNALASEPGAPGANQADSGAATATSGPPNNLQQQVNGTGQQASPAPSQRDSSRQYMWQRHSRMNHSTVGAATGNSSLAGEHRPVSTPAQSSANSLTNPRSPLTKQVSMQPQQNHQDESSDASNQANNGPVNNDDEDLEQEIILDSLATMDGCDYDLDDDDLLEAPYYDESALSGAEASSNNPTAGSNSVGAAQNAGTNQTPMDHMESRSPVARRWHSRTGRSSRNQTTAGMGQGEHDEAEDEVFTLAERRNRMSLRYKREFFVRVVSDPRVYRASISGDINAHASCCSLGGASGGNSNSNTDSQRQQANANLNVPSDSSEQTANRQQAT